MRHLAAKPKDVVCITMIDFKSKLITFILIFSSLTVFSQTRQTIDRLETKYQACLDKGQFMLGCSKTFYFQMDSMVNIQYKKLRGKCDSAQKVNLKDEQLKWLAARDKHFKQNQQLVNKEAKEDGLNGGQDETMILIDKNAMFVKDRVIELINYSPQRYSADKYKNKYHSVSKVNSRRTGKHYIQHVFAKMWQPIKCWNKQFC